MNFGIGTANFSNNYGINRNNNILSKEDINSILTCAEENNIEIIDTSPDYGDSEKILGKYLCGDNKFKIITKIPRIHPEYSKIQCRDIIRRYFDRSQKNLKIDQLHGLLVHRASDLSTPNGDEIWNTILELRNEKRVCNVGISIYSDFPLNPLLSNFEPNIIQLPINVFDQRTVTNGILASLQSYDIEIHARSIFLQGMLVQKSENIPSWLEKSRKSVENFQRTMSVIGLSPLEATIAFLKSLNCFKIGIVGIQNKGELEDILLASRVAAPHFHWHKFAQIDTALLDPRNWEKLKRQQNS